MTGTQPTTYRCGDCGFTCPWDKRNERGYQHDCYWVWLERLTRRPQGAPAPASDTPVRPARTGEPA